jgi:predicted dehydrogenase
LITSNTVLTSKIDLLVDPSIDAVYIALPNGLHYEWALRSLQAGKHVLLEKPATSNAADAQKLFNHPLATAPNAPILLEAFHYQFHPAWQAFLREVRRAGVPVKCAHSRQTIPRGALARDDIRFDFALGGGCLMDVGTYAVSAVRQVLGREAIEVVDAEYQPMWDEISDEAAQGQEQVDRFIAATLRTPSGKTATFTADIVSSFEWPPFLPEGWRINIPRMTTPMCQAVLEEIVLDPLPKFADAEHRMQKTVTMWNYLLPTVWHRIDVVEEHRVVENGRNIKTWRETRFTKGYNWRGEGEGEEGTEAYEEWWTTWRCQLEEFIHRIKGRKGSGVWIGPEESIAQMEAIDDIYRKAGLEVRPSSSFRLENTQNSR